MKSACCSFIARSRSTGSLWPARRSLQHPKSGSATQFRTATGTTDNTGRADLVMGMEGFPGMQCGIFQVEISKLVNGQETIPARYNQNTTLGLEVALDLPTTERGMVYKLTSKAE